APGCRQRRGRRRDRDHPDDEPLPLLGSSRPRRGGGGAVPRRCPRNARRMEGGALMSAVASRPAPPARAAAPAGTVPPVALEHEELVVRRGRRSGRHMAIAVHSTALGPALGGVRLWHYGDAADGVRDALRLARGMTYKAAVAGLDLGG